MLRGLEIRVGLVRLREIEHAVHYRMKVDCRGEAAQILSHCAAADEDAKQTLRARDEREGLKLATEATADAADHGDRSAEARRRNRAFERLAPTDFEDEIHAPALCEPEHFFVPLRLRTIVDRRVCAERASAFELAVVRGRDDGGETRGLGELQGPRRHAARTEDKHARAPLHCAGHKQRVPRRDTCAGNRRGLREVKVRGNMEPRVLVQYHLFREHAVPPAAEPARNLVRSRFAVDPQWIEGSRHAIADTEARNLSAHSEDFARTIGTWNERLAARSHVFGAGDQELPVIQRDGAHAHADILRTQRLLRTRLSLETCNARARANDVDLHGLAP